MKLRIRGDTIRLRLKRSEDNRIVKGSSIVEQTHFPDSVLTYRLDVSEKNDFSASFDNGSLVVSLPKSKLLDWAGTDEVSLHAMQKHSGKGLLSLLVTTHPSHNKLSLFS